MFELVFAESMSFVSWFIILPSCDAMSGLMDLPLLLDPLVNGRKFIVSELATSSRFICVSMFCPCMVPLNNK